MRTEMHSIFKSKLQKVGKANHVAFLHGLARRSLDQCQVLLEYCLNARLCVLLGFIS